MFYINSFHPSACALRFRRLTRKAYAAFCSVHREVTIGCLRGTVTNLEMLKAGRAIALSAAAIVAGIALADDTPPDANVLTEASQLALPQLNVVAQRAEDVQQPALWPLHRLSAEDIKALPVRTVADLISYLPGMDVRTRGANGAQADICMRGATFDQVRIMVNGVDLSDAQTGHYAMNLPINTDLISSVEVLQGAINIITRSQSTTPQPRLMARLTGGMYGLWNPSLSGRISAGESHHTLGAEYSQSTGYQDNTDFRMANLFYHVDYRGLELQVGGQYKDAGANSFYSLASTDQFDATRTVFGSVRYQHHWGPWGLEAQASYRANYDRYEWHRGTRPGGNFHFSQNAAALLQASYLSKIGKTQLGLELRNENIHSTNLGDTIYPDAVPTNVPDFKLSDLDLLRLRCGKNRLNINYFAHQTFYWRDLSAAVGIRGNWNSMFGHNLSGGANIGYSFVPGGLITLNANHTLRMPTFTDLYYHAGVQRGNINLRPERAWLIDLGIRYTYRGLTVRGNGFYRFGRDIIDWVRHDDALYYAQNVSRLDAAGMEAGVEYRLNHWLRLLSLEYAYTHSFLDGVDLTKSMYLDYLSHKAVLRIDHGIWRGLGASWSLRFEKREGYYTDAMAQQQPYRPIWLLDGSIFWEHKGVRCALECTNMTNTRYAEYGGIIQPGAWAKATVSYRLY